MFRTACTALLLFALSQSLPAQTYQMIMSNEDTAFSVKSGAWGLDKTGGHFHTFKFSAPGPATGSSQAVWTLDAMPSGTYQIEFYVDNGDYAQSAEFIVESDAGTTTVIRSQNYVGAGWHELGTFQFTNAGRITQTDHWTGAGTKVIADALRLTFQGTPSVPTIDVVPPAMTIVIDDMGTYNPNDPSSLSGQLLNAVPNFTFAVMPASPYTQATLQAASARGIEMILHQPMQYVGQGNTNPSDTVGLYTGQTSEQILNTLRNNLNIETPYIIGLNNHTGSRFSQYQPGMQVVIGELAARNMVFYDSRTICDSIAYDEAKRQGVLTGERDLFIDGNTTQETVDYILSVANRARYAPNYAHQCIGHPRVYTDSGILQVLPTLESMGVSFRRLSRSVAYFVESDFQPQGASFTTTGNWQPSADDMISQECNDGNAFTLSSAAAGSARFTPNLPRSGNYQVFVGFVSGANPCDSAKVTIQTHDGPRVYQLNQTVDPNRWHYLGTYPLDAAGQSYVTLDNSLCTTPSHVLRADCVKFVYDGELTSAVEDWSVY